MTKVKNEDPTTTLNNRDRIKNLQAKMNRQLPSSQFQDPISSAETAARPSGQRTNFINTCETAANQQKPARSREPRELPGLRRPWIPPSHRPTQPLGPPTSSSPTSPTIKLADMDSVDGNTSLLQLNCNLTDPRNPSVSTPAAP